MNTADVAVIGGGLIGLAVASSAAARGATVILIGESTTGEASAAGAGMLAPGAESDELRGDPVVAFATAGRDLFPSYLAALRESTGIDVPLDRNGILELISHGESATLGDRDDWLDATALRALEPALGEFRGAVLHPNDGAVDNVQLLRALRRQVELLSSVTVVTGRARAVDVKGPRPRVMLAAGGPVEAASLVLAAGAWVGQLQGLPRSIPVSPVRGQMLALGAAPVRHVTYGAGGYVVPRTGGRTLIGATMEDVGYDNATTGEGLAYLESIAARVSPALGAAPRLEQWAGLRPLTPDHLPILGADPEAPCLLYACGHGRNGILLAPITGEVIGAMVTGESPLYDLTPFAINRFATAK